MNYSTHVVLINGSMKRVEVEAQDRRTACMRAVSMFPPCSVESVTAWPIRESKAVLDALSLRVGPSPIFDSAFGALC